MPDKKGAAAQAAAYGGQHPKNRSLENYFSCQLDLTRIIESACGSYRTKITGADGIGWIKCCLNFRVRITGARVVEEVSGFCAELELQVLPDVEILEDRKVDIAVSRTMDGISP